jgi:probable HAF family extracellular repeat protein
MRHLASAMLLAAAYGCGEEARVTQPVDGPAFAKTDPRYQVVTFSSTLGGSTSIGNGINNRGWVSGFSNDAGNATRQAVVWRDGELHPLGTLGGPNSNVQWPGINNGGTIVGIAETAELDSLGEDWSCSAFFPGGVVTGHVCRGFVWQDDVMTALPTFGGTHGFAAGVNSRGQVVGWAETTVHDPTCDSPQVLQFRAALWEPKHGTMRELPPYPGDSTSAATAINERGQAVGISGECDVAVGRFSAQHAVLWEKGRVTDIGNLGGISWHTPMAINQSGVVVGFSNPPGDANGEFIPEAFIWTRHDGIESLGKLSPDDGFSQAFGVNARGQVVGRSCGAAGCRAFLYDKGTMHDLNDLVGTSAPGILVGAQDISDAGRITGRVVETSTGRTLAFVATPIGQGR